MINYEDIPLHIRCTQRYLIDPTYSPEKFHMEANKQFLNDKAETHSGSRMVKEGLSDRAQTFLDYLTEHGETKTSELSIVLGCRGEGVHQVAMRLAASHYPVYEYGRAVVVYGILGVTDKEAV